MWKLFYCMIKHYLPIVQCIYHLLIAQHDLYTVCVVGHRKGAGQAILTMVLGDCLG
jgi:hypothetical protein